jgi:hypothetical protein
MSLYYYDKYTSIVTGTTYSNYTQGSLTLYGYIGLSYEFSGYLVEDTYYGSSGFNTYWWANNLSKTVSVSDQGPYTKVVGLTPTVRQIWKLQYIDSTFGVALWYRTDTMDESSVYGIGSIRSRNIVAEDGTYPSNGRHTDGYWYIRREIVPNGMAIFA